MDELILYILSGLVSAGAAVMWWVFRTWVSNLQEASKALSDKLDDILKSIERLNINNVAYDKDIGNLREDVKENRQRLNNHSNRINRLETNKR